MGSGNQEVKLVPLDDECQLSVDLAAKPAPKNANLPPRKSSNALVLNRAESCKMTHIEAQASVRRISDPTMKLKPQLKPRADSTSLRSVSSRHAKWGSNSVRSISARKESVDSIPKSETMGSMSNARHSLVRSVTKDSETMRSSKRSRKSSESEDM